MRIALCGTRGIPARYGGFETFAEELAPRLVAKGHEVVVYGRKHVITHQESHYKGVELRILSAPQHKYLETPVHTIRSFLDLLRNRVDVVLLCNAANSPFIFIPRLFGMPVAINLDGVERKRGKWNIIGKTWYLLGEICSVLLANKMIADAQVIRDYYRRNYGRSSEVIRYGSIHLDYEIAKAKIQGEPLEVSDEQRALFEELQVRTGRYLLYVSRLEPENNALRVIQAYKRLPQQLKEFPLLIVGDAPYAAEYIASLHQAAEGENVVFAGYRFEAAYRSLQTHALLYIQATEVGGTHPALVEAMGFAKCVIANGTPENREVVGQAAKVYERNSVESLSAQIQELLSDNSLLLRLRMRAYERAREEYDWDKITNCYEGLLSSLCR